MLCTKCRKRPAASVDGRCTLCAVLKRAPANGLMTAMPTPMPEARHRLRSPVGLANAVVVLLSVAVLADVLALAAGLHLRNALDGVAADDFVAFGDAEVDRADMLFARAGSLQYLALLATAVVFIMWFRRVRLNAEVFDASLQRMKPGWAVGAWFVPLANLWLPRRIADDIWSASARLDSDGTWRTESAAPLNLWWAAWVLTWITDRYASLQYQRAELPQEIRDAVGAYLVADVLDIAAAVLAILFVRKLTRMQGERVAPGADLYAEPAPAGPAVF